MPWHDILPDWLNPWKSEAPPPAQEVPTAAPAPAPAPQPSGGSLAPEAAPELPGSDLVYLGLNDPSRAAEMAALPEGATVIDGSKKSGTILSADGKTVLDLTSKDGVEQFLAESGVAERRKGKDGELESDDAARDRVRALQALFLGEEKDGKRVSTGMPIAVRDEMAELIQTLQKVEDGDAAMKRLIISGHHYPDEQGIHGPEGREAGMRFQTLTAIMKQFPGARAGVEDLMFSACNTVNGPAAQAASYQDIFPELQTTWGYNDIAPAPGPDPKNSSPAHIKAWEEASRGTDPAEIEALAKTRYAAKVYRY